MIKSAEIQRPYPLGHGGRHRMVLFVFFSIFEIKVFLFFFCFVVIFDLVHDVDAIHGLC